MAEAMMRRADLHDAARMVAQREANKIAPPCPACARHGSTRLAEAEQVTFTPADLAAHRARMERCRLSGCTPDEHRCQDDEQDFGSFGDDAA